MVQATAPLPISRLEGEVSTLNYNIRVVSSPIEKLSLDGECRYNDASSPTHERNQHDHK